MIPEMGGGRGGGQMGGGGVGRCGSLKDRALLKSQSTITICRL